MDVLCMENKLLSVLNIRLNLHTNTLKKSLRKIHNKGVNRFKITIGNVKLCEESEQLYQDHKKKFKGFVHKNLRDYLYSGMPTTVFNTRQVRVYDNEKLVACSYFDLGENSIASLLGLYNSDYAEYSLGIFTMIVEMNYNRSKGFKWYYPGYILNESDQFDYKLRMGDFQFYNHNKRWVSFKGRPEILSSSQKLLAELEKLEKIISKLGLDFKRKLYPYFGIGYLDMWGETFLKAPVVLEIKSSFTQGALYLSYDLDSKLYALDLCDIALGYEHLIQKSNTPESEDSISELLRIQFPVSQSFNALQISKITLDTVSNGAI